ncbi:SulP family inorganic anion transporter [Roseiconus lacunae]|uniref:bifunctional SulP family inorganic anion transporter/carbonic anhydrase n=1 Tax=Roseiconus lacunae TaxID=2605694 RepID=UPI0030859B9C|nr:SulP family inorganic anion transporter [Stieleria sp. HD01]
MSLSEFGREISAGIVVSLVALPLCLGIALASNAPLFAGLVAGIVGGILVGYLSGSQTSVSGPAAALAAIVAGELATLGSFQALQLAVVVAGFLQIGFGLLGAGLLAKFFPSSVIKGLLAAIGVILILRQIPHVLGHHEVPVSDLAFRHGTNGNTFSELASALADLHVGAAAIGMLSIGVLVIWDFWKPLKRSTLPSPVVIVLLGVGLTQLFRILGQPWQIDRPYLVTIPTANSLAEFAGFFGLPDFASWSNPAMYKSAITIAVVASLATLLNLQAVDEIDPKKRTSPANRELLSQGVGNLLSGFIGGLPITSVIIRGSVNINAGAQTKISAIVHGILLLTSVALFPVFLNSIPLSCLAAILLVTGFKLISPTLVKRMWNQGWPQFVPFAATVIGIIVTDLLVGVAIGMGTAIAFILVSSVRRPLRLSTQTHMRGDVLHIELADQITFLNRGALAVALESVPRGGHVLLDGRRTDYVDPDLLSLIIDFKDYTAPAREVELSLLGFRDKYNLGDQTRYIVHSTKELQDKLSPADVIEILQDGNQRFRSGNRLTRDPGLQVAETSSGQHPLAVVLSCIDSRCPAELIFDLGIGDIFNVRIAGNISSRKILGSIEYGCSVMGAKLVLVLGHTNCGAVTTAVDLMISGQPVDAATKCENLESIIEDIQKSIHETSINKLQRMNASQRADFIDGISRANVRRTVSNILESSKTLSSLKSQGRTAFVGAIYCIRTGEVELLPVDD